MKIARVIITTFIIMYGCYLSAQGIVSAYAEKVCAEHFEATYVVTWDFGVFCRTWINGTEFIKPLHNLLEHERLKGPSG